jgi:hypothetical protein
MATGFRTERLQIILTIEELAEIEDFRFEHRTPSLSAAVRRLLYAGLASKGFSLPEVALPTRRWVGKRQPRLIESDLQS